MCTQGNIGEQPVAECFTLYKYIGKNTSESEPDNLLFTYSQQHRFTHA